MLRQALHSLFLSTLSLRRATHRSIRHAPDFAHFYPRSPCGERPWASGVAAGFRHFYPRSPCGERLCTEDNQADFYQFLSTLSLRRATAAMAAMAFTAAYFYPRSPCGERPGGRRAADRRDYFYPRSPCGERLVMQLTRNVERSISIHALLAESDTTYW